MSLPTLNDTPARHRIERLRHEIRRRELTVTAREQLSPRMLRFTLSSPDLHDFLSAGVDDHVKLFFDTPEGPVMRDFTPRAYDNAACTLVLDFALHDHGPAADWARKAQVGSVLSIGGPRGSLVVTDDFDWYLLIADSTGLPSIGRRLESLRESVPVTTLVLLDSADDAQAIATRADWTPHWLARDAGEGDDATRLLAALRALEWPQGDGYVWIAAEAGVAKALRAHVLEERGHYPQWMRAAGYWLKGEAGAHETLG
ncbi:MAG: siderophore-interacting protein [Sphingomonadales bacterium]|nr:siderophore-interacting protein [Sphingomonadales bacterium]MDE2170106.1 siderophore-interacting protein [Sphingomonadales bacterium]